MKKIVSILFAAGMLLMGADAFAQSGLEIGNELGIGIQAHLTGKVCRWPAENALQYPS